MKSPRLIQCVRCTVLVVLLLALHISLAPWTVEKAASLKLQLHDWWARHSSQKYIEALRAVPPQNLGNFVTCAVAFRDHLAKRNMRLVVVLRPAIPTLLAPKGGAQLKADASRGALFQAEAALEKAHVDVFNLLPPLHESLSLRPELAVTAPDGYHLGEPVTGEMRRILDESLSGHQLRKSGQDILFAGDCYAYIVGAAFRAGDRLPHVRVLWRNGGSHLMPSEMAMLPEHELDGVRQVMWFVTEEEGASQAPWAHFPQFPPPEALRMQHDQSERTVKVTLTRATTVSPDLGKGSPYADALAVHEFSTAEGEVFLGLIEVMKNRYVNPSTRWGNGWPLLLTIVPWEAAGKSNPALHHEQILDDAPNFTLPRYHITRWLNAP